MEALTQKQVLQEAFDRFHAKIANEIAELLIRYQSLEANQSSFPPQVFITAHELNRLYPEVFSEQQLILLLGHEWERIQTRYESMVRMDDLLRLERPSWRTIKEAACPFCDHAQLSIVPGTDGKKVKCAQCDEGVFDRDILDVSRADSTNLEK